MRTPLAGLLAALEFSATALLSACSSSSAAPPPTHPADAGDSSADTSHAKDAKPDVIVDPDNCVKPGSPGYCSPRGGQCVMAGPGGTVEDCTADLKETPPHQWYCTLPCTKTSQCSPGSECKTVGEMGPRCVPIACVHLLPDSGPGDASPESGPPDAPADVSIDGAPDAAHDAPPPG